MGEPFELVDPRAAQEFLQEFPAEARRSGEACFRGGRVQVLAPEEAGWSYSARVQDHGQSYEAELHYEPERGWDGRCACAQGPRCPHLFAAMNALLAEYRTAVVRRLSSTMRNVIALPGAVTRPKPETANPEGLAGRLRAAVGRPLTREETRFLRALHQVYLRGRQRRQVTYWDLQQLGLPMFGAFWNGSELWPAFPENEHEFWLYLAHALQEQDQDIPEFMRPITDFGPIEERLARWRRRREIERWKQNLATLQRTVEPPAAVPAAETDLRVAVDKDELRLERRRPGEADFEPLKHSHLRQLAADYEAGRILFTPEAELLWQFFSQGDYYGPRSRLRFRDLEDESGELNRLFRSSLLQSRLVTAEGTPLGRAPEPLRWQLTPAADETEDYRLRLVQADGSLPPPLLCIVPGAPTLYVTPKAVFAGPEQQRHILETTGEARIPAPALEGAAGVAFLQRLGVELPPRLRERVRTLSYAVTIKCQLRRAPAYYGSSTEDCLVETLAEAPDGHRQAWTGYNWLDTTPRGRSRKMSNHSGRSQDDQVFTVYDNSVLATVPPLLEPLRLKPNNYGEGLAVRVTRKFPETFTEWLKGLPPHIHVQLEGELASLANADVAGRVKLDVAEAEIDWFDLRVVLDVADTTLTAEEIKLLLNAKGGFVRLAGKGWRRLHYELTEEEDERLARLGLSTRELSAEPQRLHALQLADEAAKKFLPQQQVEQIQRRVGELKARVAPALPARVTADLRPYQLDGYHFLAYLAANRFGGILADDMGLGKTLQTLAWLLWLREPAATQSPTSADNASHASRITLPAPPSLVVCPKSVMDNWHAEAARFTPGLRVRVWSAGELDGFTRHLDSADLHVVNYSQLRSLGEELVPLRWQAVILDEGQYIKNPNSQTAQVARALRAEHRLVLTGTPIENRLLDLWSLMAFAMPGVLGNRAQFAKLYDAKGDPFARRRLASRVRPFILRRTKAQVATDLPDRIEEDLYCDIEGEQQTLYRAELKRAQQLLLSIKTQKELAQQQFNFLTSLLRLRQICCHPRLMKPDSTAASAKTDALLEQLEPLMDEGQKVLVFSQFVEMLDLLQPVLEQRGWPLFYLAGHTENRGELVRQFQQSEGPAVFLISLKAGGFGLNLTAASYVMLFDPWWNPAVENQAIDRTHRIGQTRNVIAYRLLIKNSIEEKIRALQKQKKALAEDVLGEEKFAQSLTLEDLQFLFAE